MTRFMTAVLGYCLALAALSHRLNADDAQPTATEHLRSGKLSFGWAQESIVPDKPVAIAGQYITRITGEVLDPITVTALATLAAK